MAKNVTLNLLPNKSKRLYTTAYNTFKKWSKQNNSISFCEDVLLAYFSHLSKKYAPSSLWATYSMLKCTINTYDHIDISRYNQLTKYLKTQCLGYRPKKSQVFSKDNIAKFLKEAPDDVYLCEKVALIFGIAGALRREEYVNITVDDVRKLEDDELLIKIPKTKNFLARSFTIMDSLFHYCWKYMQARPENCQINRFFLRYTKGKCIPQAIGINKFATMARDIAEYLNLPDANDFTGHSLRRTSATLLVDAGAELTMLQQHREWKSETVVLGYKADSINNKKKNCDKICSGINIQKQAKTTNVVPCTESEIHRVASTSGVTNTCQSEDNQSITPQTATPCILKKVQSSGNSNPLILKPNQEPTLLISDNSICESFKGTCKVEPQEPDYHPDIGLGNHQPTDQEAPKQYCIFNNCNVYISGSNNNFIFNKCNVEDKAVQTENNGEIM